MRFVTKEPINKGWSSDKRYCVTDENGTRYLLRVSDIAQHNTKQSEYNLTQSYHQKTMCKHKFGKLKPRRSNYGNMDYSLNDRRQSA